MLVENWLTSIVLIFSLWFNQVNGLLQPLKDDFYTEPSNISAYKPGEVIRKRSMPQELSPYYPPSSRKVYQIVYCSQDSFGKAAAYVATVFEPDNNPDPSKLLAYQAIEDAADPDCAPSYTFAANTTWVNANGKFELLYIEHALQQGYYVVAPDYEGLNNAFCANKKSGYATLDSIRAAKNFDGTKIDQNCSIVTWGYSGGSIPGLWSSVLAESYAPELNIIGAAIGGAVQNTTSVALAVDGTYNAGIAALAIKGMMNEYPDMEDYIYNEALRKDKIADFNRTSEVCLLSSIIVFYNDNFFGSGNDSYFKEGVKALKGGPVKRITEENAIDLENDPLPKFPIFLYSGKHDIEAPLEQNAELIYEIWSERNINSLEFELDSIANHEAGLYLGGPAAFAWIENVFNKGPVVKGSEKKERLTSLLYPGVDHNIVKLTYQALQQIQRNGLPDILSELEGSLIGNIQQAMKVINLL